MRTAVPARMLLREILVPLFCAFMALAGLAEARAAVAKAIDPASLALCVPDTSPDGRGSQDADHDCGSCCLPTPVGVPVPGAALPQVVAFRSAVVALLSRDAVPSPPLTRPHPRGPPAAA